MSVLLVSALSAAVAAAPSPADVQGKWVCGPYTVRGEGFDGVAVDRTEYAADGSYRSEGQATYTFDGSERLTVRMRQDGKWVLNGDVLEITYDTAEFLSSDSPAFTMEMGQAAVDAQMKQRNWAKKRVLGHSPQLVTVPVDPMHKAAMIEVTCTKD